MVDVVHAVAVHPHHLEHAIAIDRVPLERPLRSGHLRRERVGLAGHDRGQRSRHGPTRLRVVRQAFDHQQRAQVGIAQAERSELVAPLGDPLGRVARQVHGDLLREEKDPAGMLVSFDVEFPGFVIEKLQQIEAGEVAGGVVEENELAAGIRCVDAVGGLAGVPLVDGVVELQARVGALPGGLRHLPPQLPRGKAVDDVARGPGGGLPDGVLGHRLDEPVGHAHRVVRVLAGDGAVGVPVEV